MDKHKFCIHQTKWKFDKTSRIHDEQATENMNTKDLWNLTLLLPIASKAETRPTTCYTLSLLYVHDNHNKKYPSDDNSKDMKIREEIKYKTIYYKKWHMPLVRWKVEKFILAHLH